MSVWDDAEKEIEQESLSGKVVEAAKSWGSVTLRGAKAIASNIKDDIGRSIGLLTSPWRLTLDLLLLMMIHQKSCLS